MKLTIIIPTFNASSTLGACIESVVSQTYPNKEILVIDGLSSDNTIGIINTYASEYPFIYFLSEKDRGIYNAMNKGIELAKGDWLYFLGSDDKLVDRNVLQKVVDAMAMPTCDVLYGNVRVVGDASWAENRSIYDGPFTKEKLIAKNICHQAIFYKKEVFAKLGFFNEHYTVCADWDFNHRCFASVTCRYIDLIIADFYAGGVSTQKIADRFTTEDFVFNLKKYYRISFFNRLFKDFSSMFFSLASKNLIKNKPLTSLMFLVISLHHSTHKTIILKSYLRRIFVKK